MKVILCGFHASGCKALELLLDRNYDVFVYTHEKLFQSQPDLIELCKNTNVDFSTRNISKTTLPFSPDLICSISYRYYIQQNVIESCHGKIFNLHPSLLPKYKGCSSIPWAIIEGESETGYTYHYIDNGYDTGSIILQNKIKIENIDTQESLFKKIFVESMSSFYDVCNMVINGVKGYPQKGTGTYFKRGCPFNGEINPHWDLTYIERFIRAMIYPPYKPATFKGYDVLSLADYLQILEGK